MKKISLMSDDYAQIIAFAAEHGHETTETDPGKILDSACDYLETKHPELITDLNVARYAKNLVKHPPRKKLIPAIILTVLLGTTAWAQPPIPIPIWLNEAYSGAINACKWVIKKENPYSAFDAYLGSDGLIRYFGYRSEWFHFEKCMDQAGYPIKPRDEQ